MNFEKEIKKLLLKEFNLKDVQLSVPPNQDMGDYSFPCFSLSKKLKKSPNEIAIEFQNKLKTTKNIKQIKAIGPYLNFYVNNSLLAEEVLIEIHKQKKKYGSSHSGKGKKALIEHTSINPNASPHVGRARNAIIGDSITRILKFEDYKTKSHYYVNDIGKQISMLSIASEGKKITFENLLDMYVDFNKKLKDNPDLEKEILANLKKLEDGDKKIKKGFKQIVDVCIRGQSRLFSELGITYDAFDYESQYLWNNKTKDILNKLKKTKKLFVDEHGRQVLDLKGYNLPMKVPVYVLTRGDGTSLYSLRDLAYTIDKLKKTRKNNFVVLGEDHKLYFNQMKTTLSLLNLPSPKMIPYSFVLLKGEDTIGKMATRKGTVVLLSDLMREAKEKAIKAIKEKRGDNYSKKKIEQLSKDIAYGAIKFSMLKVSNEKNVIFDWNSALNFEGESAPYLQYTHARASSILRKANKRINTKNISFEFKTEEENKLIKSLKQFKEIVKKSIDEQKPNYIANYLVSLSQEFNEFYHKHQVIVEDAKIMEQRIILVDSVRQVLENGLNLLGINAPCEM
ncbi:arginine--tRNA ligase [archaeon]|jgi:arginyl-tRNA synthetase|nr:arginine--tRNA ligase [archaeon]MBT6824095.1 arginine--tRNA ligase [archaeon]MBT7107060.1 arginine--tRNA ligase [archaeon]MBT7297672.1 arginine--tRNA ligase [archaeon]